MTTPEIAAGRFLQGLVLGAALGLLYGFLRPLSHRRRTLADCLFIIGVFPLWLYFSFAICQGDLGLGYLASLAIGGFLFDGTIGRLLRPVWSRVWMPVWALSRAKRKIFEKNICIFEKISCVCEKIMYNKIEKKCSQRRTPP